MIHKPIHYTHHAARELKKARLTRRDVLEQGLRRVEVVTPKGTYYASTLTMQRREVEVIWLEFPDRIVIVTVYVLGEYD